MKIQVNQLLKQGGIITEVMTTEELVDCSNQRVCNSLWGVSVKGIIHLGYDPLIVKQQELIQAGFEHKVIIADVHTLLETPKIDQFDDKLNYTHSYFKDLCGLQEAKFVIGSSFQHSEEYNTKLSELLAVTNIKSVEKILATGSKCTLGNYIYPAMQALDIPFTNTNVVFGGSNQRGIYMYAREVCAN